VAASIILKVEHSFRKNTESYPGGWLFCPALADLVILAIGAPQVTVAEEHCPRALGPGDRRFLTMVAANGSYHRQIGGTAESPLARQPVDTTLSRANITRGKPSLQGFGTTFQLT